MALLKTNEEWMSIVRECRASGLTDRQWCMANGIPTSTFYYNVRRLRKAACEVPLPELGKRADIVQEVIPLQIELDPSNTTESDPCSKHGDAHAVRIEYMGMTAYIPEGIAGETITELVTAMRNAC